MEVEGPDPAQEDVEVRYDLQAEREWARLDEHRTELSLTLRAMADHLPPPPARILDCGGGPGRYAIELTRRGYSVTLFDLSAECLQLARQKAAQAGVELAGVEKGSAADLARFPGDSFDAVLLLGPLYHLVDSAHRQQALAEAQRVLKPGGPLFVAFLTRYAVIRWAAVHEPTWLLEHPDLTDSILTSGVLPPRGEKGSVFVAYCAHPSEVVPFCQAAGLDVVAVLGVEGVVSMIEEQINALSGKAWEFWVDLNYQLASDPTIHGCTEHLLVVAVKPSR